MQAVKGGWICCVIIPQSVEWMGGAAMETKLNIYVQFVLALLK